MSDEEEEEEEEWAELEMVDLSLGPDQEFITELNLYPRSTGHAGRPTERDLLRARQHSTRAEYKYQMMRRDILLDQQHTLSVLLLSIADEERSITQRVRVQWLVSAAAVMVAIATATLASLQIATSVLSSPTLAAAWTALGLALALMVIAFTVHAGRPVGRLRERFETVKNQYLVEQSRFLRMVHEEVVD